ncbi:MAG: type II secretion system protein [Burkholderiales bacterium]|nr:type II secretion system protein [Burkholderiales bacterium]
MTRRARGFSLIEMAFVLIIVTLLLGGLLVPFATQVEQKRIAETNKALEEIKEALIGYALSHTSTPAAPGSPPQPFLPCPNTNGDGLEGARGGGGDCLVSEGNLPWATLGTTPIDAWGNRFRYRVTNIFSNNVTGFDLNDPGTLTICGSTPTAGLPLTCPVNQSIASGVPAVVLSSGKNGLGGISANTGVANPPPVSNDEIENTDAGINSNFFVSRIITGPGAPIGEFDDQVIWLSPNVLFNRMVAAGRLP